jgi:hypothetical protein
MFASLGVPAFQGEANTKTVGHKPPVLKIMYGIIFVMAFALVVEAGILFSRSGQLAKIELPAEQTETPKLAAVVTPKLEVATETVAQETVTKKQSADLLSPVRPVAIAPAVFKPVQGRINANKPEFEPALEAEAVQPIETAVAISEMPDYAAERTVEGHMQALKEATLAGLYSVEVREDNGKRYIVLLPDDMTIDSELSKSLLLTAADNGQISLPEGATIDSGQVDLDTMLFNLVQRMLVSDGTIEGTKAAREMTQRAFVASGKR